MEHITLGQIAVALAFVAALIVSIKTISGTVDKAVKKGLDNALKPTNEKIDNLEKKIDSLDRKITDVDMNACKNFLVARLDEKERGEQLGTLEEDRFWEQYNHYISIGGNGSIQHRVSRLGGDTLQSRKQGDRGVF